MRTPLDARPTTHSYRMAPMDTNALMRRLPKTDELLKRPDVAELSATFPRPLVLDCLRDAVSSVRGRIRAGEEVSFDDDTIVAAAGELLIERMTPSLRPVINATGIIVHTNLGRSVLAPEAIAAAADVAAHYSTLEYDVRSAERGSRHVHVESLLCRLTGAEAAMAVNNNAAAVLLGIAALAHGREAVVSRGQLVEIGGSFRIPDIMAQSGATMVEVGTTNKTHLRDYERAIGEGTGLLLKVHSSNFRVVGFTEEVSLADLVDLGNRRGVPVYEDQGSGVLVDLKPYGLPEQPTVHSSVQAGIIVGKAEAIAKCKAHPLARALRLDKMTLAALEATLRLYLDPERAMERIPTLRMLTKRPEHVAVRARHMVDVIGDGCGDAYWVAAVPDVSRAGGGALPMADIPTTVVTISPRTMSANELEERLRLGQPTIVARIKDDRVLIDPRTLTETDEDLVIERLLAIAADG